jgi:ankyrin repeat protein
MVNPRSPVALLFASLILTAGGEGLTADSQPSQRLAIMKLKPGDNERQAWIRAIGHDEVSTLRLMMSQYQIDQLLETTTFNGKNALMVASKTGDLPLVQALVSAGADIDDTTATNGTAFMFAVLGNQFRVAQWLAARGADINVVGSNGWTALTIAAAKGYLDLLDWLIGQGAHAQVRDVYRFTPLIRAVENNHERSAALLLSLPGTDVNAQDEFDNTALHHAVSAHNAAMVSLLLKHSADVSIRNRSGLTPGMLASGIPVMEDLFR